MIKHRPDCIYFHWLTLYKTFESMINWIDTKRTKGIITATIWNKTYRYSFAIRSAHHTIYYLMTSAITTNCNNCWIISEINLLLYNLPAMHVILCLKEVMLNLSFSEDGLQLLSDVNSFTRLRIVNDCNFLVIYYITWFNQFTTLLSWIVVRCNWREM